MIDCDTCNKRFSKTGNLCHPNKDGSCAWWEQDPELPTDRLGKKRSPNLINTSSF